VDTDAEVEALAKKSIPRIFAEDGEDIFRAYETKVLSSLGKQSGLVIATGGGCVTRKENYEHLHQNGCLIWLHRDIQTLPTDGRPLSASGRLEEMYRIRKPLYKAFADHQITNFTPKQTAEEILTLIGASL
jgi:shikimate dehydrogenase